MIFGLVSDFLPECKSKRIFGLFLQHAGTFGADFFFYIIIVNACRFQEW